MWGQLWVVDWIPLSSVIVLANWFPLFLAGLAAAFWVRMREQTFLRRLPVQLLLIGAAVGSEIYVIPAQAPECGEQWMEPSLNFQWRVCLQTTPHTCSAAAAATILHQLGIEATEQEMAVLCLTRRGTTWLGLYHGLSVRLANTPYKAEFFECDVEDIDEHIKEYPVLLCCELTDEVEKQHPEYATVDGWIPGVQHSLILFAERGGHFFIGDPSQKDPEFWSQQDVALLWSGRGLKISRR
jgi:hypothetical protein